MSITAYKIESVGHDRTGKDYGYVNIMYRYGNKRSCPQPDQCEKMEVMWADEKHLHVTCKLNGKNINPSVLFDYIKSMIST